MKLSLIHIAVVTTVLVSNAALDIEAKTVKAAIAKERSAVVPSEPKWVSTCNQLAPCCGVLCSLAPLPTILQISKNKSTGGLPLLPYSSMVANGFLWMVYGWLQDLPSIWSSNMIGTILGIYYFKEFKRFCPAGTSNLPGTARQHKYAVSWIILSNTFLLMNVPKENAAQLIGKEAVMMYIILFASPLAALKDVIATKSAASIPLPFTIASIVNCSLWSIVGLLKLKDFNIYFPSLLGLSSALVQLFLKVIYDDVKGESSLLMTHQGSD